MYNYEFLWIFMPLLFRCAGIHRNLGVHISKVKSVNLDSWTPQQVAVGFSRQSRKIENILCRACSKCRILRREQFTRRVSPTTSAGHRLTPPWKLLSGRNTRRRSLSNQTGNPPSHQTFRYFEGKIQGMAQPFLFRLGLTKEMRRLTI